MTEQPNKLEPALTPEEWALVQQGHEHVLHSVVSDIAMAPRGYMLQAMAIANHALPDDDPRKITRELIDEISDAIWLHARAVFRGDDDEGNEADVDAAEARVRRAFAPLLALLPPTEAAS